MDKETINIVLDLHEALALERGGGTPLTRTQYVDLRTRVAFWYHYNAVMTDNAIIDNEGNIEGHASKWNPVGLGECIVTFTDGSADSCIFNELKWANGPDKARDFLNAREQ